VTTPTPSDDVKPPEKGSGFWIDKISVENLRHICRNGTATMMLAPLGNCIDAIEDAQARIARLIDHIEALERDAARWRHIRALGAEPAAAEFWAGIRLTFHDLQDDADWVAMADDGLSLDAAIDTHRAAIASEAKP